MIVLNEVLYAEEWLEKDVPWKKAGHVLHYVAKYYFYKGWMPITSSTAGDWCKKIGEMIDEPTLHPHDFRHSGATLLKNAGMSLEDVSSLLNHAGTDVTNKYYIKKDTTKIQSAKDRFEI